MGLVINLLKLMYFFIHDVTANICIIGECAMHLEASGYTGQCLSWYRDRKQIGVINV